MKKLVYLLLLSLVVFVCKNIIEINENEVIVEVVVEEVFVNY